MKISRKERVGRIAWLEEEMLFVYCAEHDTWEFDSGQERVVVDRKTLESGISLGAFQRAVMITIDKSKGA